MYGSPKYSGKHAQEPTPSRSLQTAFAPQGELAHGLGTGSGFDGTKQHGIGQCFFFF